MCVLMFYLLHMCRNTMMDANARINEWTNSCITYLPSYYAHTSTFFIHVYTHTCTNTHTQPSVFRACLKTPRILSSVWLYKCYSTYFLYSKGKIVSPWTCTTQCFLCYSGIEKLCAVLNKSYLPNKKFNSLKLNMTMILEYCTIVYIFAWLLF